MRESIATTDGSRQHDAAPAHVDERVRGAEVDRHVAATEAGEVAEEAHAVVGGAYAWSRGARTGCPRRDARPAPVYRTPVWRLNANLRCKLQGLSRPRATSSGHSSSKARHRQADDVEVVALDARARARRRGPGWRSRRRGRATPRRDVPVERGRRRASRKVTRCARGRRERRRRRRSAKPLTTSCVRPGERAQRRRAPRPRRRACPRSGRRARRPCRRQDHGRRRRRRPAPPAPCAARSRARRRPGRPRSSSSTSAGRTSNAHPSALEDLAALGRATPCRSDQRAAERRRRQLRGRTAPPRARPTRASPSRGPCSGRPRSRSRRGSSPARPRAGWSRRSPGARR